MAVLVLLFSSQERVLVTDERSLRMSIHLQDFFRGRKRQHDDMFQHPRVSNIFTKKSVDQGCQVDNRSVTYCGTRKRLGQRRKANAAVAMENRSWYFIYKQCEGI